MQLTLLSLFLSNCYFPKRRRLVVVILVRIRERDRQSMNLTFTSAFVSRDTADSNAERHRKKVSKSLKTGPQSVHY